MGFCGSALVLGYLRVALLWGVHVGGLAQHASECYPGGHRILRNPYRSVDFDSTEIQNIAIQDLICDHALMPGWYRFRINNKPAEMPTTCIEMNHCGTQAPMWLSLKDTSLPWPGQVRQLFACATWQFFQGSTKDCCLFRIPIMVRNCGAFLVYYLQPTQGCMGYCAKELGSRLCSPGEVQVNGQCKAVIPSLPSRPVITPELIGHSVHLRCSFVPPPWSRILGFQVVWARHVSRSMKAEIKQESTLKPFSLVKMDGVHFRLGETFSCSVSTFAVNSNDSRASPKESESFYAGLKFSPDSLHIEENSKEHEVTVQSTVPTPCFRTDPGHECGFPLALSVHNPDSLGHKVSNLVLSACQVEIQQETCNKGSCGSAKFYVTAVTDFTRDGNRLSLVSALPRPSATQLWRNYVPTPLQVTVQDVPTSICHSLTDPHVITLDRRRYENHQTGTFVLYRSLTRRFEVHSRQWDCSSQHYSVACNCGVAVQEGNDVAIFDMCKGQLQETKPQLTLKNLGDKGSRVKVFESHQGRKVTLIFPSGAFVRADVRSWGMSLSVRAPSPDYNNTQGLCGTFDDNGSNDFQGSEGGYFGPDDLDRFIEDWRIAPGESLFDKTPSEILQEDRRPFCQCHREYSTSQHRGREVVNLHRSLAHSDCTEYDNVDSTSVFAFTDTTVEYIKDPERKKSILKMSSFSSHPLKRRHLWIHGQTNLNNGDFKLADGFWEDHLLSVDRPKRQTLFEFRPIFASQSLSQVDLESFAYFFPEDHLADARPEVQPHWPTPSGLTAAKALKVCQMALINSTVGVVCQRLLGHRLDEAVNLCMLDLQLKDDLGWKEALLPYLENECERQLLENPTQRITYVPSSPSAFEEVGMALRCPNFCNGNGECTKWGCQCYQSYSFHDCSMAVDQPFEITDLENNGLCDIRAFDCRNIRVFGLGFIDSPDLSCLATRLKYMNSAWVPGEQQHSKATFLSSKAMNCAVPSLSNTTMNTENLIMDNEPYARWEIKVTNDGSQYSQAKVLTIYDSVCQVCEASLSGHCKLKEKTCIIDGVCFAARSINPSSPCLVCDPNTSKYTWSVNKGNKPPSFHQPQMNLQTFAGENFVFQFAASDPEGSALLFQLEKGPEGAAMSPAGLLVWRVPSLLRGEEEVQQARHSLHFTLSDECNAQSTFTVKINVVPCSCLNGGTCKTDVSFPAGSGKYLCVCRLGKQGELCERDVNECLSAPCASGECISTSSGYRCKCPAGLQGLTCLEDINECERKPCFPEVVCFNTIGSYRCGPCPKGMLGNGITCSEQAQFLSINGSATCASRPCYPGVQCINRRPPHVGYVCGRCPPGLYGNGRVCMKTSKEASHRLPRQQMLSKFSQSSQESKAKASHLHLPSFPPRQGIKRQSSSVTRQINAPHQDPVLERGGGTGRREAVTSASRDVPRTTVGALRVLDSHTTYGSANSKLDTRVYTRSKNAHFQELVYKSRGAPTTATTATFKVTSSTQSNRVTWAEQRVPEQLKHSDPPKVKPWTPSRPAVPPTTAFTALFYTLSESELSEDGDEVETKSEEMPPLEPAPTVATPGKTIYNSSLQKTPSGLHRVSSGTTADKHLTACSDWPCFPGVKCEPTKDGGFHCGRCPTGYTGDGRTCRAVCRHTCGGNMECVTPNTCRCKPGYTGINCQTAVCGVECMNGGVCVAPNVCQCPRGFHGETCQEALCRLPCENGGSCVGLQTCSCLYGFVGPRCETMVCSRHCHNGGQCVSPDRCLCPPGWTGPSCETALCSPACLNGGLCVRPNTCECPHSYYGIRCQNVFCNPPCKNGGSCARTNVCSCLQGHSGRRCEKSVCHPRCMNGGRCIGPNVCDCPSGWRGIRCDEPSCLQKCLNGGECVGPNTCHCAAGWQGVLCQIPRCEQNCLYGSRCVRPNVCACRSGYSGSLCSERLPITRG